MTADPAVLLEPGILLRIVVQIALFVASAFFSGSETALFSLSRMDLRKLRRERNRSAETIHALLDQPRHLIISVLCGNTLVNIAATANMTGILIAVYGAEAAAWISTFVMVPLLLLFGEATPKTVAVSDPIGVSTKIVAKPMSLWVAFVTPVSTLVRKISDKISAKLVAEEKAPDNILQVDEFRSLIEEGVVSGELSATERSLIYNLMLARSTEVVEIMTPRTRIACVDGSQPLPKIIDDFLSHRHKRVPVFLANRDNITGFLYEEDIFNLVLDNVDVTELDLQDIMRKPVMVPPTKKVDEMFDYFQNHNVRAACVLDEFGGITGFITLSDILTYIFGRPQIEFPGPNISFDKKYRSYEVPGDLRLNDFNSLTNVGIDDPRMTTIGGVVFRHLDRLPAVGDELSINGVAFTVIETEGHRISRLKVSKAPDKSTDSESDVDSEKVKDTSVKHPVEEDQDDTTS